MLKRTLIAASALTLLALGAVTYPGATATPLVQIAHADDAENQADWDSTFEKRLEKAAQDYEKLRKFLEKKDLAWSAQRFYRKALLYCPDDSTKTGKELLEYFGYEKWPDGNWVQTEAARDHFRNDFYDEEDPNGPVLTKNLEKTNKRVAKYFRDMARKAQKFAEEEGADQAAWKEREARAWMYVIKTPGDSKMVKEAHQALDHPKIGGKYVTPYQHQFMTQREERRERGQRIAGSDPEAGGSGAEGPLSSAGLSGVSAARSAHIEVATTHGEEVAIRACKFAERGIADALESYGFPDAVQDRLGLKKMNLVKDHNEWEQVLKKGLSNPWPDGQIQRYKQAGLTGVGIGPGERIQVTSPGRDVDDIMMNVIVSSAVSRAARSMAIADVGAGPIEDVEDWLWQSMGYDVTRRVTGTAITVWGAFGKYGKQISPKPGQDVWIELARMQVELDDDVPMTSLYRFSLQEQQFNGPATVKGYAFLQFLFEKDLKKAQDFVWRALAKGTPQAAVEVYGEEVLGAPPPPPPTTDASKSPEQMRALNPTQEEVLRGLDRMYAEWCRHAWYGDA